MSGGVPDVEDEANLFLGVGRRRDDEQAIQQIDGDAVRAFVTEEEANQMTGVSIYPEWEQRRMMRGG